MMYREFTVREASEYLESDKANIYKLIERNIITPLRTNPIKISEIQLLGYLNTKIPSHLKVFNREAEVI